MTFVYTYLVHDLNLYNQFVNNLNLLKILKTSFDMLANDMIDDCLGAIFLQALFPSKGAVHLPWGAEHSLKSNFEVLITQGVQDWVEGGVKVATPEKKMFY